MYKTTAEGHASELLSTMLSAIAFCCFKVKLAGKVDEKRKKLVELLGPGDETEEEKTGSETEEEKTESEGDTPFDKLNVSDIVEVYWSGEDQWFEGEVTGIDDDDKTIEVYYKSDGRRLWHSLKDYRIRLME